MGFGDFEEEVGAAFLGNDAAFGIGVLRGQLQEVTGIAVDQVPIEEQFHAAAVGVSGGDVGAEETASWAEGAAAQIDELAAGGGGEVVEESGAVDEVKVEVGCESSAAGGVPEDIAHGALKESESGGSVMACGLGLDGFPGVFECIGVHIDESKIDVGADGGLGDEVGHFPCGAAADVIDLGAAAIAGGVGCGIDESLGEEFDAGAVSSGGGLLQEPDIEDLGEEGGAAAGVTEHHVDHGVVAGVAERFRVGAVGEWGGEDPGVEPLLAILAVEGECFAGESAEVLFEAFEQVVECGGGLGGDGAGYITSPGGAILGGGAGGGEFHLVGPSLEVGEEGDQVCYDDLEFRVDVPVFLAIVEEAFEECIVGFVAGEGGEVFHGEQAGVELSFEAVAAAFIDEAGDGGLAFVGESASGVDLEAGQGLGQPDGRCGVVDVEDGGQAGQADEPAVECAVGLFAI